MITWTRTVTWGHNKDHRPDLKQLLYILTVSGDGAVPVQFRVESGNATDDRSHQGTWELLCKLTGRRDFLCVADCKLATAENMAHLHHNGGRFVSVLPRTRGEDATFRTMMRDGRPQDRGGQGRRSGNPRKARMPGRDRLAPPPNRPEPHWF